MSINETYNITWKSLENLTEDEFNEVEKRMRPGILCTEGFIGREDSLRQRYNTDKGYLSVRNITFDQVTDCLEAILLKAETLWERYRYKNNDQSLNRYKIFESGAVVAEKFLVTKQDSMMLQLCPFRTVKEKEVISCGHEMGSYRITQLKNDKSYGKSIRVSRLFIHLIKAHIFFEGASSDRISPKKILKFLELEPNQSYKIETRERPYWSQIDVERSEKYSPPKEEIMAADAECLQKHTLSSKTVAYVLPYFKNFKRYTSLGGPYLHIFAEENFQFNKPLLIIGGVKVMKTGSLLRGHYIFEKINESEAVLGEGDYINEKKTSEGDIKTGS